MRYEQRMRKYWQKKLEDPLPKLPEDERIYLNVPYMARDFAKYSHCGFDPEENKRGLKSPLLFWVQGVALPLGEPRVLIRSVKTHTGLLLTKVTKPCIMDSSKRKT